MDQKLERKGFFRILGVFAEYLAMYGRDMGLLIKSSPIYFSLTILITAVNTCVPLISAFLTKRFVEVTEYKSSLLNGEPVLSLLMLAGGLFLTYFISSLLTALMELISYKTTEKLDDDIQQRTIGKIGEIAYAKFEDVHFLNDLYKASDYSADVLKNNMMSVVRTATAILSLGVICGALAKYSLLLMCVIIASSVLSTVLNLYLEKQKLKLYNGMVLLNRRLGYFEGCMRDSETIRTFRGFNAMGLIRKKYVQSWDETIKAKERNEKKSLFVGIFNNINNVAAYGAGYCIIGSMFFDKRIGIEDFIYLITIVQTFTSLLRDVLSVLPESKRSGFVLQNYNKIREMPSRGCHEASSHIEEDGQLEVEFRNVSFRYPAAKEYALKNMSFSVKAGSMLGIVGENGAGKSTIVKLLLGLYEPTDGCILINGKDKKDIPYKEMMGNMGVIFQDYSKYATTLKENIYLGNVDDAISEEKIMLSGKKSGVSDFVDKCKNGWDQELTKKLTEEGMELSGGQWQRLALAKAFYKDGRLIILDEPMASLDPKIERDMFLGVSDVDKTR